MQTPENDIVISLKGIQKSFGSLEVLKGIDLEVRKGENVVILGRSGSGKSVLIKIIAGLLLPDAGSVQVLGQEVDQLDSRDLRELRTRIGFSFQGSALYDGMTVRANLEFPLVRNKRSLGAGEIETAVRKVLSE